MSTIKVDFGKKMGPMKIMHSVNNGPSGSKERNCMSNFETYKALEIPYARNHDASFCHDYGLDHTVDVERIFRNWDADVNDPAAYDFEMTDKYIADTESVGTKTFYRLGARIEHVKQFYTFPPKDYQKWAEICEHIIRHYTEGWGNGFHYDIEYWEIWNEPDCGEEGGHNPCWQGTRAQFAEFFVIVLRHLKTCFPHLKIGGPALCNAWRDEYFKVVFDALKENNLMVDFYSFHGYHNEPYMYGEDGDHAYEALAEYGQAGKVEMILNEWNYVRNWFGEDFEYSIRTVLGLKGASFIAGTMCTGQKSKLDHMMYYDARPSEWNGMFDIFFRKPLKGYYPFAMYRDLYKMGQQAASEADEVCLYNLAAVDENTCGLMLTYYMDEDEAPARQVEIEIQNAYAGGQVEYYLLDADHDMQLVRKEKLASGDATLYLDMKLFDTYFIKITKGNE